MTDLNRRKAITALGSLMGAGLLQVPTLAAAAQELIVTTYGGSWEKFWRATLLPAFSTKSKISPKLDIGFGRTYTTNLRAAGVGKSPYGVIMTNEIFASVLRDEGHFEKLDLALLPSYADLYPIATSAAKGFGAVGLISPIGIGYRTEGFITIKACSGRLLRTYVGENRSG